jgi:transposase InsO family protein
MGRRPRTTVADVAHLSAESPHDHSVRGLLHRGDDPLPGALCLPRARARLHVGVTAHPTAAWTAQQLREAFPWDTAPRYLLRDRDSIFGHDFVDQVKALRMSELLSTPGAPWQRAYIERVIGTIRRECLDHVIVVTAGSLRRHLNSVLAYYRSA